MEVVRADLIIADVNCRAKQMILLKDILKLPVLYELYISINFSFVLNIIFFIQLRWISDVSMGKAGNVALLSSVDGTAYLSHYESWQPGRSFKKSPSAQKQVTSRITGFAVYIVFSLALYCRMWNGVPLLMYFTPPCNERCKSSF